MGGSIPGWACLVHLSWGSFVPHASHLSPWNNWPSWTVLLMAMSEEQESKRRNASTRTKQFHVSALVMPVHLLLTKANYMVKHRIKGQGNELYLSMGRTSKTDDKGNEYREGSGAGGMNAIRFPWVQFHARSFFVCENRGLLYLL